MKLKKIRGVPLPVCSGEQKIAYNYAWRYKDILRRNYKTAGSEVGRAFPLAEAVR